MLGQLAVSTLAGAVWLLRDRSQHSSLRTPAGDQQTLGSPAKVRVNRIGQAAQNRVPPPPHWGPPCAQAACNSSARELPPSGQR